MNKAQKLLNLIESSLDVFDFLFESDTVWTKDKIKEKIQSDDLWLARAIVSIFNRQTDDEQESESTRHKNGMGFSGVDSNFLSSLAKQIIRKTGGRVIKPGDKELINLYKTALSDKQKNFAKKIMTKYSGQLAKIANNQL